MGRSVQICGKSGLYYAEVPCLHQSNLHMEGKLREWRTQNCNPCFGAESPPRSTRLQTTRFHAAPYGTVSANLRKVGTLLRRGTVFAPIQSTYGREATGMENPKMRSLFWFRKRTSQYGPVNYPVSCSAVWDRQCKLRKVGASFRRGTVFAPIQSTYEKEATGMENPKMRSLFWFRKRTSQYGPVNYPVSCSAVWDRQCKLRKVGASFRRGTVFAPIQSTYEKEATGMENPKMQSLFWCRKPTSQYAPANYPVSCSAVMDRECKFAESRGFLSPRYRVCTNPIYI